MVETWGYNLQEGKQEYFQIMLSKPFKWLAS